MYYEYPNPKDPIALVPGFFPAFHERPFDFSPPEGEGIKHPPVQFHPNSVWRKYEKPPKIRDEPEISLIDEDPRWDRPRRYPIYNRIIFWEQVPAVGIPHHPKDRVTDGPGTWVYHVAIQTDESFNAFTNRLFIKPVHRKIRHHGRCYRYHKVYDRPSYPDLPERVVWRPKREKQHEEPVPKEDVLLMPAINEEDEERTDDAGDEPKSDDDDNGVPVAHVDKEKKARPDCNQDDCKAYSPEPPLIQLPIMCYDKHVQTRLSFLMGNRIVDFDVPVPKRRSPYPINTEALESFIAKMEARTAFGRYKRALMQVFTYLRPEEILIAARVSKLWLHVAFQEEVWKGQILDASIDQVQVETVLKYGPCLNMVCCRHLYMCPQKWRIRDALLATYCKITRYRVYQCISEDVERWSVRMMQKLSMTLEELELFDVSWDHLYYLEFMPNLRKLSVWSTRPVLFEFSDVKVGWAQLTHLKTNIHPELTRSLLAVHCQTLQDVTIETPPRETDAQDSLLDLFLENTFPELLKVTIERYCLPLEEASCDREIEALRALLRDVEVHTTPHTDDHSEKRRFYQELPKKPWEPPSPPPGDDWVYPEVYEPQPLNWIPLGHDEEYADEEAPANGG